MSSGRVRPSRINVVRLVAVCCLVAGVILTPSGAFAAHADSGSSIRDRWKERYEEMVPVADDLYDEHLRILREEGEIS